MTFDPRTDPRVPKLMDDLSEVAALMRKVMAKKATLDDFPADVREALGDKTSFTGVDVGCVLDNVAALEMIVKFGAYGGRVSTVTGVSRVLYVRHGLENMILDYQPKLRARP